MEILRNQNLKVYNTFGVNVSCSEFVSVRQVEELNELISNAKISNNSLILGGGSNVLFTGDFDGLVIHNAVGGIELVSETKEEVQLKVGSGVVWHDLVMYCVRNDWGGIENLSLIPGCVGAAPMQNVGAYGVEMASVFISLEAMDLKTGELSTFTNRDCEFGYRTSVFKTRLKNQFCITSVELKLSKNPTFNIEYGAIRKTLESNSISELSVKAISDAVIQIRKSKLPDPSEVGNAGSFFKNPVIDNGQFQRLMQNHPEIPHYPAGDNHTKVPAGWLIEECGWKGKRIGDAGCHSKQALVLVNHGSASGKEIYGLSSEIAESVRERFDVKLEREVNVI